MTLLEICQWISDTQVGTALRESQYMFPLVEGMHVLGLGASVGLVLWTDLRLISGAFTRERVGEVTGQLRPFMISGFAIMFITGFFLFWAEASRLYASGTFKWKLAFLFAAGVNAMFFEWRESKTGEVSRIQLESMPLRGKLAGWISLVCWICVILFGRWTAYGLK